MTTQTHNVIETRGLTKSYTDVPVLKSLDLSVPRHSIFGFLGPNGAGKTTTMKILLGLTSANAGSVQIFGRDIQEESLHIRSRLGYLPQHPTFPPFMTVREVLNFAARFYFRGKDGDFTARVDEMLELVGLSEKGDRVVKALSGGERQRLGIAQAQVHAPDLLILDEPAASLDPIGRHDVLNIMERLQAESTIFYSTHILDDVQQVSDTVAILNQGVLVAQGTIESMLGGSGDVIYEFSTKGRENNLADSIRQLPWVAGVETVEGDSGRLYTVSVSDDEAAEGRLLREVLTDQKVIITSFRRKALELEEVFMDVVKGANNG